MKSDKLFVYIVGIAVVQGLLYALLIQPGLFDEVRHIQFIQFYADHLAPFVSSQSPQQDYLGQVSREPSYLYYYLMSFVYRFVDLFTHDIFAQVLVLRLTSIACFVGSLFILRKLLNALGFSVGIINATLLSFVLVPVAASLIGVVSYDVGVLPLTLLIIYFTIKILKSKTISLKYVAIVYGLICLASVIKFTSLPVSLVCSVAIVVHIARLYWHKPKMLLKSARTEAGRYSKLAVAGALVLLTVGTLLFVERPVQNILAYKSLSPTCLDTIKSANAAERCETNYVYKRNADFLREKPASFRPGSLVDFTLSPWVSGMTNTSVQQYPDKPPTNLLQYAAYAVVLGGVVVILLAYRDLARRYKLVPILVAIIAIYAFSVLYSNYQGFAYLGKPVAISARYLIPVLPLFIVLILASLNYLVPTLKKHLAIILIGVLLLVSQGAGFVTHFASTEKPDYWPNDISRGVGDNLSSALRSVTLGL